MFRSLLALFVLDFARSRGLGGAMLWELSSDDAEHTLLRAIQ